MPKSVLNTTKAEYEEVVLNELPDKNNEATNKLYVDNQVTSGVSSHSSDSTIHFTEASIDHTNIMNIGTNSHTAIDNHIAGSSVHGLVSNVVGESDIQTLTNKTINSSNNTISLATSTITSGTFADARIAESNVTQHEGALTLSASQTTSGTFADARIAESSVTQHEGALTLSASQTTSGTFANGRISQSSVTQHEGALTIGNSQIPSTLTGKIYRASDGSSSGCSFSFDTDNTAGMYFLDSATDQVRFAIAATDVMSYTTGQINMLKQIVMNGDPEIFFVNTNSVGLTAVSQSGNGYAQIPDCGSSTYEIVMDGLSQTLTNKTIDADNNTITNLAHGAEVDNPSSGVHGVTGSVVGTTDTQTLSGKTYRAVDGSVSVPSYSFDSYTNTGMYFMGTGLYGDMVAFSSEGVRNFYYSGPQIVFEKDVRINNSNPEIYFERTGESQIELTIDNQTGSGDGSVIIPDIVDADYDMVLDSLSQTLSNKTIEANDGSIDAPSYSFASDSDSGMYLPSTGTVEFVCGADEVLTLKTAGASAVNSLQITNGTGIPIIETIGDGGNIPLDISTKGSGNLNLQVGGTDVLRLSLDTSGDNYLKVTGGTADVTIETAGNESYVPLVLNTKSTGEIFMQVGGTEKMQVSNSRITSSVKHYFDVSSGGNSSASTNHDYAIYVESPDSDWTGGIVMTNDKYLVLTNRVGQTSGVSEARLSTGGSWSTFSDTRMKENMVQMTGVSDNLKSINVYRYNLLNDSEVQIGVSAQQIVEVFPEIVVGEEDTDKYLSVMYDRLGAVAIQACKELREKIDDIDLDVRGGPNNIPKGLNNRMTALEGSVAALQSQVQALEDAVQVIQNTIALL